MFFSHGSMHSRAVCILLNPSLNCIVRNIHKNQIGRIISIDLNFNERNISLCNVYAPNDLRQLQEFIHSLNTFLMSKAMVERRVIVDDS